MVRRRTKPRRCPVMPAGLAAVVPAGLRRRVAPAPHARMEAAGAGLRLVLERLDGVWRRAAKVRRRVVSWFSHAAHSKVFPGSTMKWRRGKSLLWSMRSSLPRKPEEPQSYTQRLISIWTTVKITLLRFIRFLCSVKCDVFPQCSAYTHMFFKTACLRQLLASLNAKPLPGCQIAQQNTRAELRFW